MDGIYVASGFLLLAAAVSIPASAGRAGIPLILGAAVAVLSSASLFIDQDAERSHPELLVKIGLYGIALTVADGATIYAIWLAALADLLANNETRPQCLAILSWIVGTQQVGVALIGYIDGYPTPGVAIVNDSTYALAVMRGVLAWLVGVFALFFGLKFHEKYEQDDERRSQWGLTYRGVRASALGWMSFWLIFTAPVLMYGFGIGVRVLCSPRSNLRHRMWALTSLIIAANGVVLGLGVLDYAVWDGKYGSAYWPYLR